MKHITFPFIILIIGAIFTASCKKHPEIEKKAMEKLSKTIKVETADGEYEVKCAHIRTVYCDDSLCIVHADAQSPVDSVEYVIIRSDSSDADFIHKRGERESVYITEEEYNKKKIGTIYESLPYESGLRYIAARERNIRHIAQISFEKEPVLMPNPLGTGLWEISRSEKEMALVGCKSFTTDCYQYFPTLKVEHKPIWTTLHVVPASDAMARAWRIPICAIVSVKLRSGQYKEGPIQEDPDCIVMDKDSVNYYVPYMCIMRNGNESLWGIGGREIVEPILSKGGTILIFFSDGGVGRNARFCVDGYEKARSILNEKL